MKNIKYLLVLPLVLCEIITSAQTYELQSNAINGGHGTATSTSYQLNGALGEISGVSTSTTYQLNAGSINNRIASQVSSGLIAYYPFNGNLDDLSGNMYASAFDGTQSYDFDVAGLEGKAFDFDGATRVAHTLNEPINFTAFTVSAWVHIDDPNSTSSQHIVGLESTDRLFQIVSNEGSFGFWEGNTGGGTLGYWEMGPIVESWSHLVVTWDGTEVIGYLDGIAIDPVVAGTALNFTVEEFSVGANTHFDEYLQGDVDEVKIFDYALSAEQIATLYSSYPPPPTAPQNLNTVVVGPGSVELTWDDSPDETYYYIYWEDPESNSDFAELPKDSTTYKITGLTPGTEYYIYLEAGNDFDKYSFVETFETPVDLGPTQAIPIPDYFTLDETITIQYFKELSYPLDMMDTASQVFIHAGLIAPENQETGDFTGFLKAEMTFNLGVWELTIDPRTDFGVSNDFVASQLGFFVTNADSTAFGFAAELENIKLAVFDPTTITPIDAFLQTDANTDVFLDDGTADVSGTAVNLQIEDRSEYTIEALINFGGQNPGIDSFADIVARGFDDGADYTPYHGIVYYEADAITAYPTGMSSIDVGAGSIDNILYAPTSVDVSGNNDAYANGTWSHVAIVYTTPSSGNLDIYINGLYQGAVTIESIPEPGNILKIGQFAGGVDELRFWDDVRSQEEIRMNLKTEIDPSSEGLLAYWKMNGIIDNVIPDETTGGNDLIAQTAVVKQTPDLDFITQTLNPTSIAPGELLTISYTIENIGLGDAAGFDLDFYLSNNNFFDGGDISLETINISSGLLAAESFSDLTQITIPGGTANGVYFIIGVLDGPGVLDESNESNNSITSVIGINTSNTNNTTTSITLDNYSFPENAPVGTVVGAISYDDPDNDLFDISLVAGDGDTDNELFQVVGGELQTNAVQDFETDKSVYLVRIEVDDNRGPAYSESLTITLTDVNEAPNNLLLSNNTINENQPANSEIGQFAASDLDSDTFTYALASGGANNSSFSLSSAGILSQNGDLPEGTYSISVTVTDDGGLSITRTFEIEVIGNSVSNVISIGGEESNYRLIGVPFTSIAASDIFNIPADKRETEWRLYRVSNEAPSEITDPSTSLTAGNGYWFITTIEQNVSLVGGNLNRGRTVPKSLTAGWNAVGNPYLAPLNWADVKAHNGISEDFELAIYQGGWNRDQTQLGVMQGGYVNSSSSLPNFEIPSPTENIGSRITEQSVSLDFYNSTNEWQIALNLKSGDSKSNISGVGVNPLANDLSDDYDYTMPPTPGSFKPLQLTEKTTGLPQNIKSPNHSIFWDLNHSGPQESTTISWDQGVASMLDEPLMIALLPQGDLYDMSSTNEITFSPEKNQSVMVIYGNELPKELLFNAITAYPNPAEQEVNFRFYVDQEGVTPASVELFNLTGQRLGSINQMSTGGQWNEINYKVGTQDLLKSGIYLFKVRYNGFESVMKKLIVK